MITEHSYSITTTVIQCIHYVEFIASWDIESVRVFEYKACKCA